jgi:lysophospholipase L1-like esterase
VIKPYQILLFLLALFFAVASLYFVLPDDNIKFGDITLKIPNPVKPFLPDSNAVKKANVDSLLLKLQQDSIRIALKRKRDSLLFAEKQKTDSLRQDSLKKINSATLSFTYKNRTDKKRIQYAENTRKALQTFFESLYQLKYNKNLRFHVLHYGDSQIEGERITAFIRHRLQKEFGGKGPGLYSPVPLANSLSMKIVFSNQWKRYALYGNQNDKPEHNRYGILASFAQYQLQDPFDTTETAWIEFQPNNIAYSTSKEFSRFVLYYGMAYPNTFMQLFVNDELKEKIRLEENTLCSAYKYEFKATPEKIKIAFNAPQSPELYAVSFESQTGIYVDNIPMRGASGTVFSKMNKTLMKNIYDDLNVKLLIMEYGGNTIPYIKDSAQAYQYGRWFSSQLSKLKKLLPDVSIIVIGPGDMSTKIDGELQTYPLLEVVRDAMKKAAFDNNAAFFDMYEVMGGKNAMISWVESDPPLAASDYIHFSGKGAKIIAEYFYQSLIEDYYEYESKRNK